MLQDYLQAYVNKYGFSGYTELRAQQNRNHGVSGSEFIKHGLIVDLLFRGCHEPPFTSLKCSIRAL